MAAAEKRKSVVVVLDPDLHEIVRTIADHYGASIRGTIVRYVRQGVARDRQTVPGAAQKAPDDTQEP